MAPSSPSGPVARGVPSSGIASMLSAVICGQAPGSAARQVSHVPHESNDMTTWSPSATPVTPGPTASTVPEPSWPRTTGLATRSPGTRPSMSVWHIPAPAIFTRISPGPGAARSSGSIV